MGVPSFYRWLANSYPKIVVNAVEKAEEDDGCLANPNGHEFDNLYLDMNGIIHPCFHPEYDDDLLQLNNPVTYEEVFSNIFEYIDRILKIVRPRKLLYMAIDGVAPRAKMNQQRTRRFRAAKDRETIGKEEDRLRTEYETEGRHVLPKEKSEVSDSNIITPGTEFMYQLSKQLQTYIRLRISNNPAWKRLKVILSDANAPGEGEHKIMSFIRLQRTCLGYNPNTSHVLYGLDADLIMLALATHEIHFSILRENVLVEYNPKASNSSVALLAGKSEGNMVKCRGWFKQFDLNGSLKDKTEQMSSLEISTVSKKKSLVKKPYQFLHVWMLREYLKLDLRITNLPEKFDPDCERLIDDFIFICFFAGNDFLPHMPTLEIHEGAIDLLIHVYKEEFKNLGGYLVDMQRADDKKGGYIKLKRVEKFILAVGTFEDKIFKKRSEIHEKKLRRLLSDIEHARGNGEEDSSTEISTCIQKSSAVGSDAYSLCSGRSPDHNVQTENTIKLNRQLKSHTREISDVFRNGLVIDTVKVGSPGWKKRYYKCKFSADTAEEMENMRKNVVQKYTEGLCWVLLYYFSSVPSWNWFFPYHYGPFASDMKGLGSSKVIFQRGSPFKPFDQLMAVLPSMSAQALPLSYRSLMMNEDSSILDFYPTEFDIDTDGKRFLWQGICKLPFIEEDRLLAATKNIEKELNEEEAKRNAKDVDKLFIHSSENFALQIISTCNDAGSIKIDNLSGDLNGFVNPKQDSENIRDSNGHANDLDVLCVYYDPPHFCLHIPRVLEGATIPETDVNESDIEERQLWHDSQGYHGHSNRSYNQFQGAKRSPGGQPWHDNQGYHCQSNGSFSSPGVITKGAGSGWSPRGRGKIHDYSHSAQSAACHDASRTLNEQSRGPSWWDANGRKSAQGYHNGRYSSERTGSSSDSGLVWRPTQSTNYPAGSTTSDANGHFWSVRTHSGSNRGQGWNRYANTQSRDPAGDANRW